MIIRAAATQSLAALAKAFRKGNSAGRRIACRVDDKLHPVAAAGVRLLICGVDFDDGLDADAITSDAETLHGNISAASHNSRRRRDIDGNISAALPVSHRDRPQVADDVQRVGR